MTIEVDEIEFFSCVWFGHAPGMDFLGVLYRRKKAGVWELKYRFRYHADPDPASRTDPFDGMDTKSWYQITLKPGQSPEEIEHVFMSSVSVPNLRRVEVQGDKDVFMAVMKREPTVHLRYRSIPPQAGEP